MLKIRIPSWLKRTTKYGLALFFLLLLTIAVSLPMAKYLKPRDLIMVDNRQSITLDNVNIIRVTPFAKENILKQQQIVIRGGEIIAINPAGSQIEANSRLIDTQGAYVTPGLFDMHVHLYDRKYLMLNLAYGVTSVRAMNGQLKDLRWKKELAQQQWLGSNLFVSSPILNGKNTDALSVAINSKAEGREQVRKAKEYGFDFIKVYDYLDSQSFEAIVDEANKIGMPVAKHGPHPVVGSDWYWLEGMQSLEHVEDIFQGPLNFEFDYTKLQEVAQKIKTLNVPVVPTLETFDHLTQLSNRKQQFVDTLELSYINPLYYDIMNYFTVQRWLKGSKQQAEYLTEENKFLSDIVRVLHQNKVKLLVGSDAGTNFTLSGIATHNEMRLMNQAGLSNIEVIRAATINAAETLRIDKHSGSVEIGKVADLILSKANPLESLNSLREPFAIVKNGQWLSQQDIRRLKDSAKNTKSYYWSVITLVEDLIDRQFL